MSIPDRIGAIEARIAEITTMAETTPTPSGNGSSGQGSFQAVMGAVPGTQAAQQPATGTPFGLSSLPAIPGMCAMLDCKDARTAVPVRSPVEAAHPTQFDPLINEASEKWGVDACLIKAVIQQESNFDPNALSHCGAQGLMQLMPETARSLGVSDTRDARDNVMAGTRYLKGLLDRFNGNTRLALAAYNAGAGNVQKYGGVPPFAETQNYVSRIMANYERMKTSQG